MGVDAADFDQDGWQDLFVANVDQEMFSLYRNRGGESFTRRRARQRRRTGDATAQRLGAEVLRLRQRRPHRPAARQRPSGRHDRAVLDASEIQGAAAALPQRGRPAARRQQGRGAGLRAQLLRARARRRRLRQRRPARRPGLEQRRRRRCCCATRAPRDITGSGSRCRARRATAMPIGAKIAWSVRRRGAPPAQDRRRKLSLLARSAGDSRHRSSGDRSTGWRSRGRRRAVASNASRTSRSIAM